MASKESIDPLYPDLIPGDTRVLNQYNRYINRRDPEPQVYPVHGSIDPKLAEKLPPVDANFFISLDDLLKK